MYGTDYLHVPPRTSVTNPAKKQTAANHVLKVTQTTGSAHHFFITYAGSTDIMQQTVVQMV